MPLEGDRIKEQLPENQKPKFGFDYVRNASTSNDHKVSDVPQNLVQNTIGMVEDLYKEEIALKISGSSPKHGLEHFDDKLANKKIKDNKEIKNSMENLLDQIEHITAVSNQIDGMMEQSKKDIFVGMSSKYIDDKVNETKNKLNTTLNIKEGKIDSQEFNTMVGEISEICDRLDSAKKFVDIVKELKDHANAITENLAYVKESLGQANRNAFIGMTSKDIGEKIKEIQGKVNNIYQIKEYKDRIESMIELKKIGDILEIRERLESAKKFAAIVKELKDHADAINANLAYAKESLGRDGRNAFIGMTGEAIGEKTKEIRGKLKEICQIEGYENRKAALKELKEVGDILEIRERLDSAKEFADIVKTFNNHVDIIEKDLGYVKERINQQNRDAFYGISKGHVIKEIEMAESKFKEICQIEGYENRKAALKELKEVDTLLEIRKRLGLAKEFADIVKAFDEHKNAMDDNLTDMRNRIGRSERNRRMGISREEINDKHESFKKLVKKVYSIEG